MELGTAAQSLRSLQKRLYPLAVQKMHGQKTFCWVSSPIVIFSAVAEKMRNRPNL